MGQIARHLYEAILSSASSPMSGKYVVKWSAIFCAPAPCIYIIDWFRSWPFPPLDHLVDGILCQQSIFHRSIPLFFWLFHGVFVCLLIGIAISQVHRQWMNWSYGIYFRVDTGCNGRSRLYHDQHQTAFSVFLNWSIPAFVRLLLEAVWPRWVSPM